MPSREAVAAQHLRFNVACTPPGTLLASYLLAQYLMGAYEVPGMKDGLLPLQAQFQCSLLAPVALNASNDFK